MSDVGVDHRVDDVARTRDIDMRQLFGPMAGLDCPCEVYDGIGAAKCPNEIRRVRP